MEETLQLHQAPLSDCYQLGKALRSGDANAFCELYDCLLAGSPGDIRFSAIKEAARQISELDQEDYTVLTKYYSLPSSVHNCDICLDTYEPIALQLSDLVERLGVECQGGITSDSGALSDYDSSACETDELKSESNSSLATVHADETHGMPVDSSETTTEDLSHDNSHSLAGDSSTTITPSPAELSTSENDSVASCEQTTDTPNGTDMGEVWAKIIEASDEDSLKMTDMKLQPSCTEAITVTDLEKEFFSSPAAEDTPSEKHAEQDEMSQQSSLNSRHQNIQDTAQHRTRGYRESRFSNSHRQDPKCQDREGEEEGAKGPQPQNHRESRYYNWRGRYHTNYRGRNRGGFRGCGGGRGRYTTSENDLTTSSQARHWVPRESEDFEANQTGREGVNGEHLESDSAEKRVKFAPTSQQPSPLVVHSQNMWSAKIDTIKSYNAKRVIVTHKRHRHEAPAPAFNHYEVGCFLMEGWEQVKKELTTRAS